MLCIMHHRENAVNIHEIRVRGVWFHCSYCLSTYRMSSPLTKGAFGNFAEATFEDVPVMARELSVACTEEEEIAFLREAFIISQFNHPNIVKVVGVVLTGQKVREGGSERGREG